MAGCTGSWLAVSGTQNHGYFPVYCIDLTLYLGTLAHLDTWTRQTPLTATRTRAAR